jgi:hypothetical protein
MKLSSIIEIANAAELQGGTGKFRSLVELHHKVLNPIIDQIQKDVFYYFFDMAYTISYYNYDIPRAMNTCKFFFINDLISLLLIYERGDLVEKIENLIGFIGDIPDGLFDRNKVYDNLMDQICDNRAYNHRYESFLRPCQSSIRGILDEIVLRELTEKKYFK